jgi:hypothetical protein
LLAAIIAPNIADDALPQLKITDGKSATLYQRIQMLSFLF